MTFQLSISTAMQDYSLCNLLTQLISNQYVEGIHSYSPLSPNPLQHKENRVCKNKIITKETERVYTHTVPSYPIHCNTERTEDAETKLLQKKQSGYILIQPPLNHPIVTKNRRCRNKITTKETEGKHSYSFL